MLAQEVYDILRPCLWGTMIESLDIKEDSFLIIERLLEHGGDKQVEFVLKTYDRDTISEVVKNSSYLSPKTVNYWCLYLNIKKENTRCFTRQSPSMWPPSSVSLKPLYYDPVNKILLASLIDIAAMKTVAIVQRGTAKDFVD